MEKLRIATVVGARPQFIKAAALSRAIARHNSSRAGATVSEILIHTGQHYDYEMSDVFFRELGLPDPFYHLGVRSGPHGAQTGQMLKQVEAVLLELRPDLVLVYGDTNSTLAGALAAAKLDLPVAHVEAGLRSYNRRMPEEINRVLTDHVSNWLFCPSEHSRQTLAGEGIRDGVYNVGDVMYDVMLWHLGLVDQRKKLLDELGLIRKNYALATIHRVENADSPEKLRQIFSAFDQLEQNGLTVALPLHPRTQKALHGSGINTGRVHVMVPVSYEDMLCLETNAHVIITDSGGIQKEAYWLGVPCITVREETEWVETVEAGWNLLAGSDPDRIVGAVERAQINGNRPSLYGNGDAAEKIVEILLRRES